MLTGIVRPRRLSRIPGTGRLRAVTGTPDDSLIHRARRLVPDRPGVDLGVFGLRRKLGLAVTLVVGALVTVGGVASAADGGQAVGGGPATSSEPAATVPADCELGAGTDLVTALTTGPSGASAGQCPATSTE